MSMDADDAGDVMTDVNDTGDVTTDADDAGGGVADGIGEVETSYETEGVAVSVERAGSSSKGAEGIKSQSLETTGEAGVTCIDPGRLEGQHGNQILIVLPSDKEVLETSTQMQGKVDEFAKAHGSKGVNVAAVKVETWNAHPELGSYSGNKVTVANMNETVNVATLVHEFMHSASFQAKTTEQLSLGGTIEKDTCGLDTTTSVYTADGKIAFQSRTGEMVNEGLTVSYSRSCLEAQGLDAAAMADEKLSYELAFDVGKNLRASFPTETDAAYFQGQLEGLRQVFDEAVGNPGAFDEVSKLLDQAADEKLSLEERFTCYNRVQDLMRNACRK